VILSLSVIRYTSTDWHTYSLEQAMQQPSELSQQAIVDNLDPKEWARLDRVRNIGIAVCLFL